MDYFGSFEKEFWRLAGHAAGDYLEAWDGLSGMRRFVPSASARAADADGSPYLGAVLYGSVIRKAQEFPSDLDVVFILRGRGPTDWSEAERLRLLFLERCMSLDYQCVFLDRGRIGGHPVVLWGLHSALRGPNRLYVSGTAGHRIRAALTRFRNRPVASHFTVHQPEIDLELGEGTNWRLAVRRGKLAANPGKSSA